jgi:predicted  nucleic acid-binding Zn-ribbon protein
MIESDMCIKLAIVDEKLKRLNDNINSIIPEIAKTNEKTSDVHEKLITRIVTLDKENALLKSKMDDLISYKNSSDKRIKELEEIKSYYKGSIAVIAVLITTGFLAVLFKLISFNTQS